MPLPVTFFALMVISHVLIRLFTGKAGKIKAGTWVIAVLFALMFFVTH